MTTNRGISTPIDVVLGLLFIGLAAGVVATAAPTPVETPPDDGRAAILGSSVTVEFETDGGEWTIQETVGGLLADAAVAGKGEATARESAFRSATRTAITEHVTTHGAQMQLVGVCRGLDSPGPFVAGRIPPGDQPIRATVYELPEPGTDSTTEGDCRPAVVLRRWSP